MSKTGARRHTGAPFSERRRHMPPASVVPDFTIPAVRVFRRLSTDDAKRAWQDRNGAGSTVKQLAVQVELAVPVGLNAHTAAAGPEHLVMGQMHSRIDLPDL